MDELGIVQGLKVKTIQNQLSGYNGSVERADVTCNYSFAAGIADYLQGRSNILPDFSKYISLFFVDISKSDIGVIVSMGKGMIVRSDFCLEIEYPINDEISRIDVISASSYYRYLSCDKILSDKTRHDILCRSGYDFNLILNLQLYLSNCQECFDNYLSTGKIKK